ncbi:hypothetical protein OIU85_004472 [Salix viminalis]|uniref:Uncharacterized protein n=1 Tax=Salix viminalis TaxID=40686 RepID=A0A9Q0PSL6_SALVM|nr:hypothetical protein OIU85_004472 [Salix viminalis]
MTAHSSSFSSPCPPDAFLEAAFWFFRFTLPGRPPPKGLVREKSMCFYESILTMKDGNLTTCLPNPEGPREISMNTNPESNRSMPKTENVEGRSGPNSDICTKINLNLAKQISSS